MDLIELKNYLRLHRLVPLADLACHFNADIATVRPLLDIWMTKGKVRRQFGSTTACKGCCRCDPATIEVYEWIG